MHSAAIPIQGGCFFLRAKPETPCPPAGRKQHRSCGPDLFRFSSDAELAGTAMVSEKATACGPGVIFAGLNVQVAFGGNVVCGQESVIGLPGAPVFSLSRSEYVAVPPGEMVCGAGCAAEGTVMIVIDAVPKAFDACCENAVIVMVAGVGTPVGAV